MNKTRNLIAAGLVMALAAMPVLAGRGPGGPGPGAGAVTGVVSTELSPSEETTLLFMREEEKLARDLYLDFHAVWQAPIFGNIAAAEQRHMDAVKDALDRYALDDPSEPDAHGWYSDPELQQLYDDLLARGEASYLEALRAGALVEEVDIEDNLNAIADTDNPDLQRLYANLLRGSRNHLRAFVGAIERLGIVYQAQYLDQITVDEIVDSPMERGGKGGHGPGRRR